MKTSSHYSADTGSIAQKGQTRQLLLPTYGKVTGRLLLSLFMLFGSMLYFSEHSIAETYVSGTITEDTTWDLAGSPYIVTGNIDVPENTILTIDPDVVVKFAGHYSISVRGALEAIGNVGKRIVFTSRNLMTNGRFISFS